MNSLLLGLKTAYLKAMRLRAMLEQMEEFSTRCCGSTCLKTRNLEPFAMC